MRSALLKVHASNLPLEGGRRIVPLAETESTLADDVITDKESRESEPAGGHSGKGEAGERAGQQSACVSRVLTANTIRSTEKNSTAA